MLFDNSTARDNDPHCAIWLALRARRCVPRDDMGMIGFDIACETARSGSRMQGYLVNDPRKQQVPIKTAPTRTLSLLKR
jgi:hypothetical protein